VGLASDGVASDVLVSGAAAPHFQMSHDDQERWVPNNYEKQIPNRCALNYVPSTTAIVRRSIT
jgi:hypothetical protein